MLLYFYILDVSRDFWYNVKLMTIIIIIAGFVILLVLGLIFDSPWLLFMAYILLVYYFGNIILSCKPRGLYRLLKNANTQAILLKRLCYTPFLQEFSAFDLGPKHCCIQFYLKFE